MALTSARLSNGGVTAHYKFQYDDSLSSPINPAGPEPARTNAVIAACENDFNLMSGWFGNIALDVNFTIPVNVTQNSGGAAWGTSGRNLTVTINPGNGSANFVRYLLVSEMVEQFMRAQNKGWFGSGTEGSQGEGLSRFLGAQFLASNGFGNPPVGFTNSNLWLTTSRDDYVNNINPTDDGPTAITGCSLLFIYYLFSQLGFSISAIVAAGASPLAGVYRNLTGDTGDPFPFFKQLLDRTSTITTGNLDNPFPLIDPRIAVSSGCAVARASDHLDVFWAAPDGSVWSNWWDAFANSGGWNLPFVIAPAGNAEPGTITCVARTRDHLDVFWVARDGSVWSNWYDAFANSGRWNLPFVIAPAGSAEPGTITCVARTRDHLDVFWVARDGSVWSNWYDAFANSGRWNLPFVIAPAGNAEPGTITAVARTRDHLDVFWVARDGSVWSNWYDAFANNGRWNQPFVIAPAGNAEPGTITAVARTRDHLDVFWVARDGSVWSNWYDAFANSGRWNQPFVIAPAGSAELGTITAVARTRDHLDVFWVARDGSVWSNWYDAFANNGRWNQPFVIAPAGNAEPGTITAVARTPVHLDVFWVARDGSVWSNWYDAFANNGRWNQPFVIAPAGNAEPSVSRRRRGILAVAREANQLDVFWIGPDGSVRSNWWDAFLNSGRWNQPFLIAPAGSAQPRSPVAAVARQANQLDVYWVGPDGSVRSNWWDAFDNSGRWNQPFLIAPAGSAQPRSPVAAVARQANQLDVYWVGPDGSVRSNWWDAFLNSGRWNQPFLIAPAGSAQPRSPVAAVARQANQLDVYWVGPDGSVRSNWWDAFDNSGRWNQPFLIAPAGSARPRSPVAAVARQANQLDVYWVGPDGSVRSNWWDAFLNSGRWNQPFLIAPAGSAQPSSPVAAVARQANQLDVYWVGPDGSVRSNWWDAFLNSGRWNQPFTIASPGSTRAGTQVAAVARQANQLDVYWVGPDGSVRSNWWDAFLNNGRWNQPFLIAPAGNA